MRPRERRTARAARILIGALGFVIGLADSVPTMAQRMPDPHLTPGHASYKVAPTACSISTKDERNVPDSVKAAVYEKYRIERCAGYCSGLQGCEIDHLISLELGGA